MADLSLTQTINAQSPFMFVNAIRKMVCAIT